ESDEAPHASTPFKYATNIVDELQGNKPFRYSVLILLLSNCAATFVAVNLPFYIQYVLDMHQQQTYLVATLFVTAIITVPIWVKFAMRYGKDKTYRVAMILYAGVLLTLPFLSAGNYSLAFLIAALAGTFHAAAITIPWAIVPDVVEHDEYRTGRRREGLFYGGTTFSYKFATGLAVFVSGTLLEWIGYVPNQAQEPSVVHGLKFMIGPIPAFLVVTAAVVSLRYPLTREKHQILLDALAARRAEQKK
ncbi:hypothetical protein BVY02_02730, partial [bacterium J17]